MKLNFTSDLLDKLSLQYGNSFYLFDKNKFENNLEMFRFEFEQIYPNVKIAYSVKTNYMPAVCELARQHGALAEVVSGLEYEIVKKVGFKGDEIIFNGPVKEKEELWKAFEERAIVQFDSQEEIHILRDYLNTHPDREINCALRCNFNIGEPEISRFGFDVDSGEAASVYNELFSLKGCNPVGIHCHLSTRHRSLISYEKRTKKLIELTTSIFKNRTPDFINIGGGFFGDLPDSISNQYPFDVPSIREYAENIGGLMKAKYPDADITLILEPGTSIVADTMKFVCRAASVKYISSKAVITLTGSIQNIKPTLSKVNVPFRIVNASDPDYRIDNGIVGGYTCMESDIICESFKGELAVGDYFIFDNVGAYNVVFKPPFIKGAPPVLMIQGEKNDPQFKLIRKRETSDMFLSSYLF